MSMQSHMLDVHAYRKNNNAQVLLKSELIYIVCCVFDDVVLVGGKIILFS